MTCAGSYASWVAGDNLAPAGEGTAGTSGLAGGRGARSAKRGVSGFAANGGAATLSVRKVAAALKVGPLPCPMSLITCLRDLHRAGMDGHSAFRLLCACCVVYHQYIA